MPNMSSNTLTLRCTDPAQIQRAVKAYNETRLLSEFMPEPDYKTTPVRHVLCRMGCGPYPERVSQMLPVAPSEAWEHWRIPNWGTKWDVGKDEDSGKAALNISEGATEVTFDFLSAYAPPIPAMRAFEEAGCAVELYYCEYTNGFCGVYTTDSGDDRYDIPGTALESRATIPDKINDLFCIADFLDECAALESDEEHEE
jgi:hypothetical protein